MSRALVAFVLLTLLYALVLASINPWDVLAGVLLSGTLLVVFRQALFGEEQLSPDIAGLPKRVLAFFPFVVAVARDVLAGVWQVTLVTLRVRSLDRAGIVEVPIAERTPTGVTVTALVTTLSPGSVLVDIDHARRVMLFHVLDAGDPDDVRVQHQQFYDRYQKHVFP